MIDFWDLLLLDNRALLEAGAAVDHLDELRMSHTGHRRPLSVNWARSIGCWGRVKTMSDAAKQTSKTKTQLWSWAQRWGVRPRTKARRLTPAQLAAGLYFDRALLRAEDSRRRWGVLPVERVLYLASFEEVLVQEEATVEDALDWSMTELERYWSGAGVLVEPPWDLVGPAPVPEAPPEPELSPYLQALVMM